MKKLCALVAALAAGWLCAAAAAAADLDAALRALDRGDAAAARGPLAEEVARLSILHALAESGDARRAAAERAAAVASPDSWAAAAAEALRAEASGDLAAAAAAAGRACELAPGDARLWHLRGSLLRRQGDRPGARAAFERARAAQPDHAAALVALGDLLRQDGSFTAAFNAYNHAVGVERAPAGALLGRATARLYFGDEQGALQDLESATSLAPAGVDRSRALMGFLYLRTYLRQLPAGLDRAEEAARMWGEMGAADEVAAVMNAAARVLLETGDAVSAEAWYQRSWQTIEGSAMPPAERTIWHVRSLHGQARCAAVRREIGRALDLAAQAKSLMDADPANADHYAWIRPYLDAYLALFDRRAEDAVPLLLASDTERPHIRLLLAQAYARLRDNASARLWYERALAAAVELDADSVIVRPQAAAWLERNR